MYIILCRTDNRAWLEGHYFENEEDAINEAKYQAKLFSIDNKIELNIQPTYLIYPNGKGGMIKEINGYMIIDKNNCLLFDAVVHSVEKWQVK